MLGRKERDQLELFITGSLRQLIPDEHVLVRVDRVLDLSWLREEVVGCYCVDHGRPGIDPEVAVRLMLAGFLLGIVQDRRLMREAEVNIAEYHLARTEEGGEALGVIRTDAPLSTELVEELSGLPSVIAIRQVVLDG